MQMKKKRRQLESVQGPVDRSKVCMRDLIYMNPVNNPMRSVIFIFVSLSLVLRFERSPSGGDYCQDLTE